MNEQEVFLTALELPKEQRQEYLASACANDPKLKSAVEELLDLHESDADFMSVSAVVSALDDQTTLRSGSKVGPYELKEPLGEGGMGVVFRAVQKEPIERQVAIKIIKAGLDTKEVVARFQTEQRTLASMDHPFVAKVLEAGQATNGRPFFVMELVDGMPITEFCDVRQLTMKQRLGLFIDVCKAIQHAHSKSVIHRDIKPSNILVRLVDGIPRPKIIDFGIAKALDQDRKDRDIVTQVAQIIGTPLYMSPEQADAEQCDGLDTRTDIYSLGVLLYELLTGVTPFDRERLLKAADNEVRRIICEEEPPKPSTKISTLGESATAVSDSRATDLKKLRRALQGDLDWIVMKSLEKDRECRYETAVAFADDLQRFLNLEPVLASPPSHRRRFGRWVRRNRTLFAVAATMLTLLVAGVVGTSFGLMKAIGANNQLEESLLNEAELRKQSQQNADLALQKSKDAERQTRVANAIIQFLNEDLLDATSPGIAQLSGKDVLVRDVLDQAAKNIKIAAEPGGKFADKPLVEAAVRQTIGATYTALGLRVQAIPHLERSYKLLQDRSGLPSYFADVRKEVLFLLTTEYGKLGRLQEAEQFGSALVNDRIANYGKDHYEVALAESALAQVFYNQGRISESIDLFERSIRIQEATKGPQDFALLTTQANLAFAYFRTGEHDDKALRLAEKMLPAAEKSNSDLIRADILESLGMYRAKNREFDTARGHFVKAKELRANIYGEKNQFTNSLNVALGTLASMQGDFEQAYKFQNLAFEISTANDVPPESNTLCVLRGNVAWCLINLQRFAEAAEILSQHLVETDNALGHTHPLVKRNYGMLQTVADELEKESKMKLVVPLRRSLVVYFQILNESGSATAQDLFDLAQILGNPENQDLYDLDQAIGQLESAKSKLAEQEKPNEALQNQLEKTLKNLREQSIGDQ